MQVIIETLPVLPLKYRNTENNSVLRCLRDK